MFVKAQEFDRIINLNKTIIVDIEEKSGCFKIVADCENDFRVFLATYVDGKDAEKYFDMFCQAIVDGDKLFRFPNDPKACYMGEGREKFGENYDLEQVMSDIADFPEEPEKTSEVVDRMSLDMALETPIWQVIYAAEPRRKIDVRMTYADLACIYKRMVYNGNDV